ncbi:MAG: hypothetical protein KC466_18310 [Myxococcales bacterium]|nr:hypothetical protein [Myxococcales bacterium]
MKTWRAQPRTPKRAARGTAARDRVAADRRRVVVPARMGRAAAKEDAPPRDPAPHWRAWMAAAEVAASLAATMSAFTWLRVVAIDLSYRVQERDREIQSLAERRRALATEYEMLRAPARLERLAADSLGLVPPGPDQIRYLR